jgi:hypothetical protein
MASFLSTLFGGGAEAEAADKNRQAIAQYVPQAQDFLTQGYNTGVGNLNSAIGAYTPLSDLGKQYGGASSMYLNALGVNGPEGTTAAQNAFQTNPGYQGAMTAGLDAINRRRGVMGMSNSGNADIDAQTFGQNLQNQQYNTWLTNLAGAGQTGAGLIGAAAQGQGTGYTNLANLAGQLSSNQVGVAGNALSGNVNANNLQAAGEAAGAKNLLGAGMSLATLAMGGMGGGGFGNSLVGSLFGGGSSGGTPGTQIGGTQGSAVYGGSGGFKPLFG